MYTYTYESKPIIRKQNAQSSTMKKLQLKYNIMMGVKKWLKLSKNSKHRLLVLKEWQKTENDYTNCLQKLNLNIRQKLKDRKLISNADDDLMFKDIPAIAGLSSFMIETLKQIISTWNPHITISKKISGFSSYFKMYQSYCNDYLYIKSIIHTLNKQKEKEVNQIMNELNQNLDLDSFFIKPVQRLPKYVLLLREYLKKLPHSHPDYAQLNKAIDVYHHIVESNNQSMNQKQLENKVIQLENRYGNLLSSSRALISQMQCFTVEDGMIRMYIFNDLILCVRCTQKTAKSPISFIYDIESQPVYVKIFLDRQSFVEKSKNGYLFPNCLIICGVENNTHVYFSNQADQQRCFEIIDSAIEKIINSEEQRNKIIGQNRKKVANSFRQSQFKTNTVPQKQQHHISQHNQHISFMKEKIDLPTIKSIANTLNFQRIKNVLLGLRFILIGVEKKFSNTYYIVAVTTPKPYQVTQRLYIQYNTLVQLQFYLKQIYKDKDVYIPSIETKPIGISFDDLKGDQSKLIQHRGISIIKFLNYVYRSKQIMKNPQLISLRIGISENMWEYISDNRDICQCKKCLQLQDMKQLNWDHYNSLLQQLQKKYNNEQKQDGVLPCLKYIWKVIKALKQQPYPNSFENLLIAIKLKEGRLILPNELSFKKILSPIKVLTYLPIRVMSFNEEKYSNAKNIRIPIYRYTTVQDIMEGIRNKFKLKTILDYTLVLRILAEENQIMFNLDDDEYIWPLVQKGEIDIDENNKIVARESDSMDKKSWSFGDFFGNVNKKITSLSIFAKNKVKLSFWLKKMIWGGIVEKNYRDSYQRTSLLSEQILYRFKNGLLPINFQEAKIIVAIHYFIKSIKDNKVELMIKVVNQYDQQRDQRFLQMINLNYISQIMPNRLHKNINNQFKQLVIFQLKSLKNRLISNNHHLQLLQMIIDYTIGNQRWQTEYFNIINLSPESLNEGGSKKLQLGINRERVVIQIYQRFLTIIQFKYENLKYKTSGCQLHIYKDQEQYLFYCQNLVMVNKIIIMYQNLYRLNNLGYNSK